MNMRHLPFPLPKAAAVAAGLSVMAGLLSGCSTLSNSLSKSQEPAAAQAAVVAPAMPAPLPDPEPAKKTKLYEWTGEGRAVTRVVVDINEQKARFYEGDQEVGWATVASGVSKFPTPVGSFSVQEKVSNKESNLYGKLYGEGGKLINSNAKIGQTPIPPGARFDGADMPYFLRLTGDGIGMHAGPIPRPGRPASHGCIRMPKGFAPIAFRHVPTRTPVTIVGNGPTYSAYLAQQKASNLRAKPATSPPAERTGQTVVQTPNPAAATGGGQAPTVPETTAPTLGAAPAPSGGATPEVTPGSEASKVAAVAHEPTPPVAPAIATRTESPETPVSGSPTQIAAQAPAAGLPQGTAHPEADPVRRPVSPPAVSPPATPVTSASSAVYYPAPQVPAYRAMPQAPVLLPPPAPPVGAQVPTPAAEAPATMHQPKAAAPPAVQPQAVESPAAPQGAS
jgi:hypothetical protein